MAISANENGASSRPPRIGLLDTARGAALIAMATYHFTWDMEFMGYLARGTAEAGWLKIYARAIASTFLFLAGVSLMLCRHTKHQAPGLSPAAWHDRFSRGSYHGRDGNCDAAGRDILRYSAQYRSGKRHWPALPAHARDYNDCRRHSRPSSLRSICALHSSIRHGFGGWAYPKRFRDRTIMCRFYPGSGLFSSAWAFRA